MRARSQRAGPVPRRAAAEGSSISRTLARARKALSQGHWTAALASLRRCEPRDLRTPEGQEALATAAYGAGDFEAAVTAWEELHALHRRAGRHMAAARAAAMVAMYLMMDTGLMAPVRGWLGHAEALLPDEDTPVHALAAMVHAYERFMCGDMASAGRWAGRAVELGTRLDVAPAVALGRVAAARVRILAGDVDGGVAALDDVAVLLMSDGLDPLTTGMVWCELICAMQGLALYDRAEQWTDAMEHWRHGAAFGGINGRCRIHRAEMLRLRGAVRDAEREAEHACDELRPWMRREFGWPLTELGTIRLRLGDLDGAEHAFRCAHERAWDPQPGLALVRLARGNTDDAVAMIDRALTHPMAVPSKERPPFTTLRRAPLLAAQVEIALRAGAAATARAAARELTAIATGFDSPALVAAAALARGRVALTDGAIPAAVDACEQAVAGWTAVRAPYEAAIARTVLADSHEFSGNDACAQLERETAVATFERLGVELPGHLGARVGRRHPLDLDAQHGTAAPHVFVCDGDTRTVTYDGVTVRLRDLKGLRYLERLLAEPGREFHALDLVAVEHGAPPGGARPADADVIVARGSDAGPVLDDQARDAYQRRLSEIDEDIEHATRMNDTERAALARVEREYLVRELSRAVGLGGRQRRSGSTAERARSSVTRTLRYALARIAEHHPALSVHLEHTVHTGTYCSYTPDPTAAVIWQT